jgi:hypothetical protein
MLSIVLSFGMIFTGCKPASNDGGGGVGSGNTIVNLLSLTDKITAPAKDAAPVTTALDTAQYTSGVITWKTSADADAGAAFAASTVYKAIVTLTAKTGFTFSGFAGNFTYTGATSVAVSANTGTTITVTVTFGTTAAVDEDTIVNLLDLTDKIIAPVKEVAPDTAAFDTAQYTSGAITWKTSADAEAGATFAASTVYKAIVTLTAKPGFTFTGLTGNFTYTGATSVAVSANTGAAITVTVTFGATAAPSFIEINITVKPMTDGGLAFEDTVGGDLSMEDNDSAWINVTEAYSSYKWLIDGTEISSTAKNITIYAGDLAGIGQHSVTVIAYRDGKPYSRSVIINVVE